MNCEKCRHSPITNLALRAVPYEKSFCRRCYEKDVIRRNCAEQIPFIVKLNKNKDYLKKMIRPPKIETEDNEKQKQQVIKLQAIVWELFSQNKLDATDLKIIMARDCSPMPSSREVAQQLKISQPTVLRRMYRIKSLIIKVFPTEN